MARRPSKSCVIATIVLAAACGRSPSFQIDDVHLDAIASGLFFNYRTQSPSGDCKVQAAEMPKVWTLVVKEHVTDSRVRRVILIPEDPSGQSVGFEFIKRTSGWSTEGAPCSISIPDR